MLYSFRALLRDYVLGVFLVRLVSICPRMAFRLSTISIKHLKTRTHGFKAATVIVHLYD